MEALKKETAAQKATTSADTEIVAVSSAKVKLPAYMREKSITGDQVAAALIDAGYLKCRKSVVSMVSRGEEYGTTFLPDAWRSIYLTYGEPSDKIRSKRAKRTKANRLVVYLTDDEHRAFQTVKPCGMTVQEYLHQIITEVIDNALV